MTTITYRDGVMASDSGVWHGDACHGWARKLAKGPDGTLYGVTGNAAQCGGYLAWVDAGCVGDQPVADQEANDTSSFCVMVATPGQPIRYRTSRGDEVFDAPYFAIGPGAVAAYGAMFVGADAATTIEAAKEHASGAFGRVQTISHKE